MQHLEASSLPNSQPAPTDLRGAVAALVDRSRGRRLTTSQRIDILTELVELYPRVEAEDERLACEVRHAFIRNLEDTPEIIKEERFSSFLAERIEAEDFEEVEWQSPEEVIRYYELLYRFRFHNEAMIEHVHTLQENLLRYALQQYEQRGEYEKMFRLLRLAPISPDNTDGELRRLQSRAYLYEMRRVRRNQTWLYAYLILQVLLIGLVFPLLFVSAENGALQQSIETATKVNLPNEAPRALTYWDGLYWAIITAASIGYGDLTPHTMFGKVLAAILGVLGVITVGVIAGLILNRISPRSFD